MISLFLVLAAFNPYVYEDADYSSYEEESEPESESIKVSPNSQEVKVGNVTMKVDVENTDFESACKAEWDKQKGSKDDREEGHSPKATFSVGWSSED